jgi:glycosyltransferase involved in cell wall biosynthesis
MRLRAVGLNALFLDPGVSGGSETYLRNLVPAMAREAPGARFELMTTRRGAAALAREGWPANVHVFGFRCDDTEPLRRTLIEQVATRHQAKRRDWQLLHSLGNRGPRFPGVPSVVTLHDVMFFRHSTVGLVSTLGMRLGARAAVSGADAVISVSEAASDEIVSTLGLSRHNVVAVRHGPGRAPVGAAPDGNVRTRLGPEWAGRIVLSVAAKRPHKNQELLVRALPHLPGDLRLVLVGHDEGYGSLISAVADDLSLAHRVTLLDYVPDAELEALWRMAACAAFPTRAEGFGLPVLEAMRRGVPVACSDLPVLREVAGDAAETFSPDDAEGAAAAILRAMSDTDAGERGRRRAASFSWERAARETLAVYERVLR